MKAVCHTRCWDGVACLRCYPNKEYDVDPLSPIAKYFTFPPGTKVYTKTRGVKGKTKDEDKNPVEGTMIVPGLGASVPKKETEEIFDCICGFRAKSRAGFISHIRSCEKAKTEDTPEETEE